MVVVSSSGSGGNGNGTDNDGTVHGLIPNSYTNQQPTPSTSTRHQAPAPAPIQQITHQHHHHNNNPFPSLTSTQHFTTLPQLVMRKDEELNWIAIETDRLVWEIEEGRG